LKRLKHTTGICAALAALGLGGAAIAGAAGSSPSKASAPEVISQTDGDTVQSGDQTTTDTASGARAVTTAAGDTADAPEQSTTETPAASDGPGGHADEPGNAGASTEQQGQN
jgi:hypothetical protein